LGGVAVLVKITYVDLDDGRTVFTHLPVVYTWTVEMGYVTEAKEQVIITKLSVKTRLNENIK